MYKKRGWYVKMKVATSSTLMKIVRRLTVLSIFSFEIGQINPLSIQIVLYAPNSDEKLREKLS